MVALSAPRRAKFGDFVADFDSFELHKHGIRLKLQDQPFQILKLLLRRPGQLITREELRMELWKESTFVDFDAGLNAAIRRLRDALNESAEEPRYIETLPRHGYRFIASVEIEAEPLVVTPDELQNASLAARGQETAAASIEASVQQEKLAKSQRMRLPGSLVAACLLVATVGIGAVALRSKVFAKHSVGSHINSIAVLPLQNLSGDPSQDYFAEGMTDALITDLAQIKQLHVISRTSTMRFKGTQKKVPEIAKELGVDAVLEGAAFRSGERVRIDAQLIRGDNDVHLWAKSYERSMNDILSLQSDLARAIAGEVAVNLTSEEQANLGKRVQTVNPQAYEAYLKGQYFSSRVNDEGIKKGVAYFQEAIRLEPDYAPAYAGMAEAYSAAGIGWADIKDPEILAIQAAKKAISLDESLSDAHASLAFVQHRHMQDWTGAEREFKRALELNPNNAWAHRRYGVYLATVGLPAAGCGEHRLAHALDPLNTAMIAGVAGCLSVEGQFEGALEMMRGAIEMEPENPRLRWSLGDIYEQKGMFPEALQQYEKGAEASGRHAYLLTLLASAYAGWGKAGRAEELLKEINDKYGEDGFLSALVHARMGRKEKAIRELVAALGGTCAPGKCGPGASLFVSEWRFIPLRPDPRFRALLERYHYPESAFKEIDRIYDSQDQVHGRGHPGGPVL
jgi:TolB-like protein/DNA-binding winged helix-turn-helix (wHTH) protein/Tfp pilus assembly protein PilF